MDTADQSLHHLFLSTLESTIVATALPTISSSLGSFAHATWIPVSYLITYTSCMIVFARLSDIFGRKPVLLGTIALFTAASGACGGAGSMTSLIVFRAFQGLGAGGMYASVFACVREVAAEEKFGGLMGVLGVTFAIASVLGPVLGGVIAGNGQWRWVFYLNLPIGGVLLMVLWWFFPGDVRHEEDKKERLAQIDYVGALLVLVASVLFIYGLEAGSLSFTWTTPAIVATLTTGAVLMIVFGVWEYAVSSHSEAKKIIMRPIFPFTLISHRVIGADILAAFLSGFAFFVVIVNIPQRFQIEMGMSSTEAGIKLIPLLVFSAVGAGGIGYIFTKVNITQWCLIGSAGLQVLGLGLLSSLPFSEHVQVVQYVYQAILGFGLGAFNTSVVSLARFEVEPREMSVTMSAITQARTMGGIVGLAVAQVVLFRKLLIDLAERLTEQETRGFLDKADMLQTLPADAQILVRHVYSQAFSKQTRTIMYFAMACFVVSLFTIRRHPLSPQELLEKNKEVERLRKTSMEDQPSSQTEKAERFN